MSGLDDYIAEERQRAGSAADRVSQSPGKFKEKPPTELELVRQAIDVLNGKIGKSNGLTSRSPRH